MKERVITGEWDGEPIWRWRTVEEQLEKELGVDKVEIDLINLINFINLTKDLTKKNNGIHTTN